MGWIFLLKTLSLTRLCEMITGKFLEDEGNPMVDDGFALENTGIGGNPMQNVLKVMVSGMVPLDFCFAFWVTDGI
jgi:hypothetical protein